jgi:hypothetical protein
MTFFSSLSRSIQLLSLAPSLAAATLLFSACDDQHIGRPCDIAVEMIADPKLVTVNPQALECPSRVCVLPAKDKSTNTEAFCTAECSSDDDCSDGERGKGMADTLCDEGFVCRTILPNLENNPLRCKPVCVCKDFLMTGDVSAKPPSCP